MNGRDCNTLPGFWKLPVGRHARGEAIHGQWTLNELRRHSCASSPGIFDPLLDRRGQRGGSRACKDYRLTAKGREALACAREQVRELDVEVAAGGKPV